MGVVHGRRIGAPLMGVTLLVALAVLAMAAWRDPDPNPEALTA